MKINIFKKLELIMKSIAFILQNDFDCLEFRKKSELRKEFIEKIHNDEKILEIANKRADKYIRHQNDMLEDEGRRQINSIKLLAEEVVRIMKKEEVK